MSKKKKFWVRVLVWVLTALMVLGSVVTVFYSCAANVSAAEPETAEYVTVGLMYGSDVTVGFEVTTTVGFTAYAATAGKTERFLSELYTIPEKRISVVCDDNLSKSAYTYSIYDRTRACVVGGWHLEVIEDLETVGDAEEMLARVQAALDTLGNDMHPFIAYINGAYKIRIGDYTSEERMQQKMAEVPSLCEEIPLRIVSPSDTLVSVVNPENDVILFEYDEGGKRSLGLCALPDADGNTQYLKTPAGRLYDGAFLFSRYKTATVNGVQLINMLPLEDYICGVVPYEISPTWPSEALRAFAISVRNYTVKNKNRHFASYGFDICNTTHCQVYRGISGANQSVIDAVYGTKGMLLVDEDGVIADIYYSSSTGGYTAGGKDTWGNEVSYLQAIATPWERYSEHGKGIWNSVVSGEALLATLRSKGYTKLTGNRIVDVTINAYSGDGPYVYSITYTDDLGGKLTIERCDKVRTSISSYLNSANFIVGKGSVEFAYDEVISIDMNGTFSQTLADFYTPEEEHPAVLTASGISAAEEKRISVQTAGGIARTTASDLQVATGLSGVSISLTDYPGIIARRRVNRITADDPENFIFAGKGWGHGVGMSQFGLFDLAEAGATAEQMLALYFPTLILTGGTEPAEETEPETEPETETEAEAEPEFSEE